MICPNCGLANPDTARFCGNCGTTLAEEAQYLPPQPPYAPTSTGSRLGQRSVGQKIGLGCLIAILIFFFFGLSCTRACFRPRRYYRRYGSIIRTVPEHVSTARSSGRLARTVHPHSVRAVA